MLSYVRQYKTGTLLHEAFLLYKRNFRAMFFGLLLPALPASAVALYGLATKSAVLLVVGEVIGFIIGLFCLGPVTLMVSDICLGNKPSIRRSYSKVMPLATNLFSTVCLQWLLLVVGLILLIIPGIIFALWYMLAPSVAVLEGLAGRKALARSKALGKGLYGRNFGISLIFGLIFTAINVVLGLTFGIVAAFAGLDPETETYSLMINIVGGAFGHLMLPMYFIIIVLIYYDVRARKEGYDITMLGQDLRR